MVAIEIDKADTMVAQMNRREFLSKIMLYGTVGLLFIAILLILMIRIFH